MSSERHIREALEDSVRDLPCPEPDIEQLVEAGRAARRRRVGVVLSLATAAAIVVVLAGLSFAWAGRSGRALEPVPASPTSDNSKPLEPGTQVLDKPDQWTSDYVQLTVTIPPGWTVDDGRLTKRPGQPDELALSAWEITGVYEDPCHWRDSVTSAIDLHDEQVHAEFDPAPVGAPISRPGHGGLANQLGRNPSTPKKVDLGGVPAMMMQLSLPSDLDAEACDDGEIRSWTGRGMTDDYNAHHAPGQVDIVYLVDVDRGPLVIDASHGPAATQADLAELRSVVASLVVDQGLGHGGADG